MVNRRGVLALIGGGVVLAATAGGGYVGYQASQPSQKAREAWRAAGRYPEYRRRFLSYALLAPNPHNRQPWRVRLDGDDALTFYCDLDKRLPATDPFDRQITLGCGAFLEVLSIAAASEGYRAEITPFPEGEPQPRLDARPIAHVRFVPKAAPRDAAFDHVLKRVTNREIYTPRVPDAASIDALAKAGSSDIVNGAATADPARVAVLRDLVARAAAREYNTPAAFGETVNLLRIGNAEVERYRDGLVLDGPMMSAMNAAGILTHELRDPNSIAKKQGAEMFQKRAMSSPAFVWLTTRDNSRATQLASGRAYARVTLKVAELGLAVHPWSQALQEYPEMADLYAEAHKLLAEGGVLQMLVRVGYAPETVHAPRRSLETLIA